jgi:hypothetical protein
MQASQTIMQSAQQRINELHAEAETIERQARIDAERQARENRLKANQAQQKINALIESANALLQQNKADLLEAIQKAEEAVSEALTIAKEFNQQSTGFLLSESIQLFTIDDLNFLKKMLSNLQIATPSNVPEGAVKVVMGAGGLTVGYGKNAVYHKPNTILVLPESQAERWLRDPRGIVYPVE